MDAIVSLVAAVIIGFAVWGLVVVIANVPRAR